MNPGKVLLGLIASLASADVAAQTHFPLEYYAASVSIFGFIFAILKAGKWFRSEVESQIKAEFEAHAEKHRRLEDKINTLIKTVDSISAFYGKPATTPVPFILPPTPPPIKKED